MVPMISLHKTPQHVTTKQQCYIRWCLREEEDELRSSATLEKQHRTRIWTMTMKRSCKE